MSEETLVAGRYRLDELIGRGPAGEVWRAHDENADWTVAVKMLTAGSSELLNRHAQTVAKVVHPNVAMVLDIGGHNGMPFLVMEYLTGQSLGEERGAHGPFGIVEACDLIGQAAAGLDAAHRVGVVHGEVDPDCFRRAGSGVLKVVGFGIQGSSQAGVPVNPYRAPEQLDGQTGPAADLYALGAVCYEMVCGRPPFSGSGDELAAQIRDAAPEPPTSHRPAVPAELEQLLLALLAKDPAARPTTGEMVRRRLAAIARPGATQRTGPLHTLPGTPPQSPPGTPPQNPLGTPAHNSPGTPVQIPLSTPAPNPLGSDAPTAQQPPISAAHLPGPATGQQLSAAASQHPGVGHPGGGQPGVGHPGGGQALNAPTGQLPRFQDGHTAIYEGPIGEEPPNQNRRLIIQLVAALAVIAVVTIGFIALSGRDQPEATPTPPAVPTETTTAPEPTSTPSPTPTQPTASPNPSSLVDTFGPVDPLDRGQASPVPKDTTGLTQTPPGGWGTWLGRFDEAVRLQLQVKGIDAEVAADARQKIAKAMERAKKDRPHQVRRHVLDAAKDLAEAAADGDMAPTGPLANFLTDWGLTKPNDDG